MSITAANRQVAVGEKSWKTVFFVSMQRETVKIFTKSKAPKARQHIAWGFSPRYWIPTVSLSPEGATEFLLAKEVLSHMRKPSQIYSIMFSSAQKNVSHSLSIPSKVESKNILAASSNAARLSPLQGLNMGSLSNLGLKPQATCSGPVGAGIVQINRQLTLETIHMSIMNTFPASRSLRTRGIRR